MSDNQGLSPQIAGSSLVAFYGQINRFLAASGLAPIATHATQVSKEAALIAVQLMQARLIASVSRTLDAGTQDQLAQVNAAFKDPVAYVVPNLARVTTTLAVYGDSIGYPPATTGITTTIPRKKGLPAWGWAALAVAVIGGGYGAFRLAQR